MLKKMTALVLLLSAACVSDATEQVSAVTEEAKAPSIKTGNGVANNITLEGVTRSGSVFTFPNVTIDQPGWLVIHPFKDGAPVATKYVGATLLAAGSHINVEIAVDQKPEQGDMFVVMLHYDVNNDGIFDFNDGITVPDAPVFENGVLIALRFASP